VQASVLVLLAGSLVVLVGTARSDSSVGPWSGALVVLQLNLCNSGEAACYTRINNGQSVPEAAGVIRERRPDVVTLNEVCKADVTTTLYRAMAATFPDSRVFWAWKAAGDKRDSGPYRCRNGDEYGVGLVGRVPKSRWQGVAVNDGIYPAQSRSVEMRAWLCATAVGAYVACTTHLSPRAAIALDQCRWLMDTEVPAARETSGGVPAIVSGDFNLRTADAARCIPPGYRGRDDGGFQHVLASTGLTFQAVQALPLTHTDHPGWLVRLTP
jgi:hypothetical protein